MKFQELESALEELVQQLSVAELLHPDKLYSPAFLDQINQSKYLITLHDVQYYRPIGINDAMKHFYGFEKNWLTGMDYFYYLQTIHTSTYHTLLNSLTFFRKDKPNYLNLEYKLMHHSKQFKLVWGSSKTIIRSAKGKPLFAITIAIEGKGAESSSKAGMILQLTTREKEIAKLLIEGLNKNEIAERLFISAATVQTHCKSIYKKLEINKISELISLGDTYSFAEADADMMDIDLSQLDPNGLRLGMD